MALEMKYFVLKPASKNGKDKHAMAARVAMRAYAEAIRPTDPELTEELWAWANREEQREQMLRMEDKICGS